MKKKPEHISQKDWDDVASPPLSNDMLQKLKSVGKLHPQIPARVRGPQKLPVKKQLTIRLNQEIVDYFKNQGKSWQTQINDVLIEYVKSQKSDRSRIG